MNQSAAGRRMSVGARRVAAYAAVLGALVVLYVVGAVLSPGRGGAVREQLLPILDQTEVTRIVIQPSGSESAARELLRDGSWWLVEETRRFPAREDRVAGFLSELRDARVSRTVTNNPEQYDALSVSPETATLVQLFAAPGQAQLGGSTQDAPVVSLLWGDISVSGGRFVKRAAGEAVYETDAQVSLYLNQGAPYWSYLRLLPESVTGTGVVELSIRRSDEQPRAYTVRKERTPDGDQWQPVDGVTRGLDNAAVTRLAGSISDLVGRDFYRGEEPLSEANRIAAVSVITQTGAEFVIHVHRVGEQTVAVASGNGVPRSADGEPYPVEIPASRLDQLTPELNSLVAEAE